jgi:hypothetical protein
MGIDIYAEWRDITKDEKNAQYTGFSVVHGNAGYLREAYHGGPYMTRFLVQEAFNADEAQAPIPAATLRERLPAAVMLSIYRRHVVYGEGSPGVIDVPDGAPIEQAIGSVIAKMFGEGGPIDQARTGSKEAELVARITDEQKRKTAELIEARNLPDYALSIVDFVRLCEAKEAEKGEPCNIIASY